MGKRDDSFVGRRVRCLAGLAEFIGQTGTVIDAEAQGRGRPTLFRVRLDEPVNVAGVGLVEDDLWQRAGLRTLRERATTPARLVGFVAAERLGACWPKRG
jgi:hypothetical protein